MKKKCRHCFTAIRPEAPVCRVCRIDPAKEPSALSPAEKKVAYRCRTLYTVGFLCIVGGFVGMFVLLPSLFYYLRGQKDRNLATPTAFLPVYVISMMVLNLVLPVFGLALRRYKKICTFAGIFIFSSYLLLHLPGFHLFPLVLAPLFLYWIASPPSRDILTS